MSVVELFSQPSRGLTEFIPAKIAFKKVGGAPRLIDIAVAFSALALLSPLLLLIALAIRLQDGEPALFWQRRIGVGGYQFDCYKFRSMVSNAEIRLNQHFADHPEARAEWTADQKLRHDPRVTFLGRFLRRYSLDELPQLINVLRGEMSMVGPRPIIETEICRYGRYFDHYCRVRPGMTGLWQIMGRNDVSYRRRVALDVTFVKTRSLTRYFTILARTLPAVLRHTGVY